MVRKDGQMMPTFENAILVDGKIYFSDWDDPALYEINERHEISLLYRMENYTSPHRAFGTILHRKGKLYLAPKQEEVFLIYDINRKETSVLELPISYTKVRDKFLNAYSYSDELYFMPCDVNTCGIVVIDSETASMTVWDDWMEALRERKIEYAGRKMIRAGDIVYAPMISNAVVQFDLCHKTYQLNIVGSERCTYSAACYTDDCLWLAPREVGPVVRWNVKTGKVHEYEGFPRNYDRRSCAAADIVPFDDSVLMIPMAGNMMVRIDKDTGKMQEFDRSFRGCGDMEIADFGDRYLLGVRRIGDKNSTTFYIDRKTKRVEELHLTYPEDERTYFSVNYKILHGMKNPDNRYLLETYPGALEDYLAYATGLGSEGADNAENVVLKKETVGKRIYEAVK